MREKFKNKYRIESMRLQNWDYGSNASYFLTFCTKDRIHYFGEVIDKEMCLSPLGNIANSLFQEIPNRYPNIKIDAMVIMPNHVHCILTIDKPFSGDAINRVSTEKISTEKPRGGITKDKNPMLHQNISRVIRWYKGRTTFECRKINSHFEWQSRFYDHIIKTSSELTNIIKYIVQNPEKW